MRSLALLILLPLITGCTNRLFIPASYSPNDPTATVAMVQDGDLDILVENMEVTAKHFVYDVEVVNKSDRSVFLDPHEAYYYGAEQAFQPLEAGASVRESFGQAISGAREVRALKEKEVHRDIRATIRSRQAVAAIVLIAATAVVVNDIVQDSQDFSKEIWTAADARRSQMRDVATFAGLVTADMIRAGMEMQQEKEFADLDFLPEEYLHRTLVMAGERIRGKVFLPRRDVDFVRIVIPVESRDYVFDFRQASGREIRAIKEARRFVTE